MVEILSAIEIAEWVHSLEQKFHHKIFYFAIMQLVMKTSLTNVKLQALMVSRVFLNIIEIMITIFQSFLEFKKLDMQNKLNVWRLNNQRENCS
jgi:hypothetical protein